MNIRLPQIRQAAVLAAAQRAPIALAVAATILFSLGFAWSQIVQYVNARIEETSQQVAQHLGLPVTIGQWRLTPVGVHLEDIVIGKEGELIISHARAGWSFNSFNPLSANFGKIENITVYHIRLRLPTPGLLSEASHHDQNRDTPEGSSSQSVASDVLAKLKIFATPQRIEKIFAALPTQRLVVKSAALTILDASGQPAITAKGLRLLLDRDKFHVQGQASSIKTANGIAERLLQARFDLHPRNDQYRFHVRQRLNASSNKTGWLLMGRLAKDLSAFDLRWKARRLPAFLAASAKSLFGNTPRLDLSGIIKAEEVNRVWQFELRSLSRGTWLAVPILNSQPFGPVSFTLEARGTLHVDHRRLHLATAEVHFPAEGLPQDQTRLKSQNRSVRINFNTLVQLPQTYNGANSSLKEQLSRSQIRAQVDLAPTQCQDILDASPRGFLPALAHFKLSGDAGVTMDLAYHGNRVKSPSPQDYLHKTGHGLPSNLDEPASAFANGVLTVDIRRGHFGCQVLATPYVYTAEHLMGPFSLQRESNQGDASLEIKVNRNAPTFTPLSQITKNLSAAFVTSEDASFWTHKGIDALALEKALHHNLAEGRVAVGGSTITMQTVKNLFLSHDRTLARKLQELFLAWHIENVLDKERILEIYANIVEFGPGIYGVTHASQHFFGKQPQDLSLVESAYLASLLPSPKRRYEHFCNGKMTPGFQEQVLNLMRRMVNLGRITPDRYSFALQQSLRFNAASRLSARECERRTAAGGTDSLRGG